MNSLREKTARIIAGDRKKARLYYLKKHPLILHDSEFRHAPITMAQAEKLVQQ